MSGGPLESANAPIIAEEPPIPDDLAIDGAHAEPIAERSAEMQELDAMLGPGSLAGAGIAKPISYGPHLPTGVKTQMRAAVAHASASSQNQVSRCLKRDVKGRESQTC